MAHDMAGHNSYTNVEVLQAVKRGETSSTRIARRLGVSRPCVCYWRKRLGLLSVRGPAAWDTRAQALGFADTAAAVRTWAAAGLTNGAMADRLGCWPAQLAPYLRGVTRPPVPVRVHLHRHHAAIARPVRCVRADGETVSHGTCSSNCSHGVSSCASSSSASSTW